MLFIMLLLFSTAIEAAIVGVDARMSATKSVSVTSLSWPTALITGVLQLKIALTTSSSLNAHNSSMDPPPRATIKTSRLNESVLLICLVSSFFELGP